MAAESVPVPTDVPEPRITRLAARKRLADESACAPLAKSSHPHPDSCPPSHQSPTPSAVRGSPRRVRMGSAQCSSCKRTFPDWVALAKHMKAEHDKQDTGECRFCARSYVRCHLPRHERVCEKKQSVKKRKFGDTNQFESLECNICHGLFASHKSLRKHQRICVGLKCPYCQKTFITYKAVGLHKRSCAHRPIGTKCTRDPAVQPVAHMESGVAAPEACLSEPPESD